MKILVTGAEGQLGKALLQEGNKIGYEMVGCSHQKMDVTNLLEVEKVIAKERPDGVIHCAAWTNVEQAEVERDRCWSVNCEGTAHIATLCQKFHIPLMYISTDYVFCGDGDVPWNEHDERKPVNYYGKTKCQGEQIVEKLQKHFIVRTSWVFGESENNFVEKILKRASQSNEIQVVHDQIGSPTYTIDLARMCLRMIVTESYGTYHVTNEGYCSWYEYAKEIVRQTGIPVLVVPVGSDQYQTKACRPKNSRLGHKELIRNGFSILPSWKDALRRYIERKEDR